MVNNSQYFSRKIFVEAKLQIYIGQRYNKSCFFDYFSYIFSVAGIQTFEILTF